jgi:hypothetical protein
LESGSRFMDLVQLDFGVQLLDLVQPMDFDVEGAIAYISKLRGPVW